MRRIIDRVMKYTLRGGVKQSYSRWLVSIPVTLLVLSVVVVDQQAQTGDVLAWTGVRKKPATTAATGVSAETQQKGSSQAPPRGAATVAPKPTVLAADTMVPASQPAVRSASCSAGGAARQGLADAGSPSLRKLAEYENACQAAIATGSSFFVPTPRTTDEAQEYARDTSVQLKEYIRFGVRPMVFMEPTYDGGILDLNQYRTGTYDSALAAYFSALKSAGLTDEQMGVWVLFPEGNIPVWNNVDPVTYATNVTKTAQALKAQFPYAQVSLLLDSQTYPSGTSWSGGRYAGFSPYISQIPKGLIDSFGLQGFPWAAPASEPYGSLYEPRTYLAVQLAAEAARILGVTDVWVNTGTFSTAYASSPSRKVDINATKRQAMLDGVISQAQVLKNQGFHVSIHLFAEDKSATSEGINWSYWSKNARGQGVEADVFRAFVHDMQASGIPLWVFDS